jgi:SIR2-like domain
LTVVVGAGASTPLGIPSTRCLTDTVTSKLLSHDSRDCADFGPRVALLLKAVRDYYGETYNFEHLWDALEAAHALVVGWTQGNAPTTSEAAMTMARPDVQGALEYELLSEALFVLKRTVLSEITDASAAATKHANWSNFQAFWRGLAKRFSLTVVTLNYDTLVEQALDWDGSQQGMHPVSGESIWRLDPKRLHDPREIDRLLHLHGSIQFGSRTYGAEVNRFAYEDSFHELYWHPTIESAQQTMWGMSSPRSQTGRSLAGDRIVSGLNKPDKLLVEPLLSYQIEFMNQIRREPRLLVVGYGFGDHHVNAALERMTRIHGETRRTCVIDRIDMVTEIGSTRRDGLMVMLSRWGRTQFEFRDSHPDPWASADGCARLYWNGLLNPAVGEVADYLVE